MTRLGFKAQGEKLGALEVDFAGFGALQRKKKSEKIRSIYLTQGLRVNCIEISNHDNLANKYQEKWSTRKVCVQDALATSFLFAASVSRRFVCARNGSKHP
jgi:hypothetical protein